jgi:hypothetical protein
MNLQITDSASSRVKLALAPITTVTGSDLHFNQHPNVAKFGPSGDRIIALKDASRSFPLNQSVPVLKWRYSGKDETLVPLSSALGHWRCQFVRHADSALIAYSQLLANAIKRRYMRCEH